MKEGLRAVSFSTEGHMCSQRAAGTWSQRCCVVACSRLRLCLEKCARVGAVAACLGS